jgi:toxin ParE1/3/4
VSVIFHPRADREAESALYYLNKQSRRLAERFTAALREATERIEAAPDRGAPAFELFRWLRVGHFRYIIYYRQIDAESIMIYAVAHTSRRPGYWLRRTGRR